MHFLDQNCLYLNPNFTEVCCNGEEVNTGSGDDLQASSHYPNQFWPRCLMTWGPTGLHWINTHDDVIEWNHFPRYWPFVRGREFTGPRWIPHTKASDAELWWFLWSRLNKRLSKQSWGWWFETPSSPLWRHCNENWLPEIAWITKVKKMFTLTHCVLMMLYDDIDLGQHWLR